MGRVVGRREKKLAWHVSVGCRESIRQSIEGKSTVPIHGEFHLLFVIWYWSMDFFQL